MIEKSLVLIKPDGVERALIGEVIKRYEQNGLRIIGMKMINADKKTVSKHYSSEENYLISLGQKSVDAGDKIDNLRDQGMMIVNGLRDYIIKGPIVAMVIEGENAISKVREIHGHTNPKKASQGTIRGDFGDDDLLIANVEKRPVRNIVHASGNLEEAEKEIYLWFSEEELL